MEQEPVRSQSNKLGRSSALDRRKEAVDLEAALEVSKNEPVKTARTLEPPLDNPTTSKYRRT